MSPSSSTSSSLLRDAFRVTNMLPDKFGWSRADTTTLKLLIIAGHQEVLECFKAYLERREHGVDVMLKSLGEIVKKPEPGGLFTHRIRSPPHRRPSMTFDFSLEAECQTNETNDPPSGDEDGQENDGWDVGSSPAGKGRNTNVSSPISAKKVIPPQGRRGSELFDFAELLPREEDIDIQVHDHIKPPLGRHASQCYDFKAVAEEVTSTGADEEIDTDEDYEVYETM